MYTDIKTIENYLLTEIDLSFHSQVEEWIKYAENYINTETGRMFIADKEFSPRVFRGYQKIFIDDCVEIEKVVIGNREFRFRAFPLNETPKIALEGKAIRGEVEVYAKWGYSIEPPAEIKHIATLIVAGIMQTGMHPKGELSSVSLGIYSASYTKEQAVSEKSIRNVLDKYKRYL